MAQTHRHDHRRDAARAQPRRAFPPFASETFASQLLWFALAFGLLYWLMSRVALPRIGADPRGPLEPHRATTSTRPSA